MKNQLLATTCIIALATTGAFAEGGQNFNRISSFPTPLNMAEGADISQASSAEIIAVTADGNTLVYTDSPLKALGRIDITNPKMPKPLGNIALEGEPTSVGIVGDYAIVGVNTSESFTNPSGFIASVNIMDGTIAGQCDLGGQPDSVAIAKDGSFASIAIENQREEELGDGRVGQLPAGYLVTVGLTREGILDCDTLKKVDVTGLADIAPEDPEPEFVDINSLGETVMTIQENNFIVIVGKDGNVINSFSAGTVDLENIDTIDERASLDFKQSQKDRKREPDAVKWLDDDNFAIANEGDMDGGSRGWTIFNKSGEVVYESLASFEYALIEMGHYPDKRSDAKGVEVEGIEVATYNGTPYVFVGSERGSAVGVYDVTDMKNPLLKQVLPSGISPEGYVAIPQRNLFVSANEVDLGADGGPRAHVMIYELQDAQAGYPHLTSKGTDELIGWGAISGMVADKDGIVWAVNDSFYGYQPTIFKIDTNKIPAQITEAVRVTRAGFPAQKLDMEGIALDGEGGFWVASEGNSDKLVPHALYRVNAKGEITQEIGLPSELLASEKRFGFEGVTKVGDTLWMPVQREWGDDPKGQVKLVSYNIETQEWGAVRYPLDASENGWTGLSELVAFGDYVYAVERDNQIGNAAVTKKIYRISANEMTPTKLGEELPLVSKEEVRDLIPDLKSFGGYVVDKVEGLAIFEDGTAWVSTDNDGVDDSSGETFFWSIGNLNQ